MIRQAFRLFFVVLLVIVCIPLWVLTWLINVIGDDE